MDKKRLDEAEIELLEEAIFQARNYVVASEDLRPRVVESAKERSRIQKIARRISFGSLACIAVWSLSVPTYHALGELRGSFTAPFPAEVEQRAMDLSRTKRGMHWGMVDAFTQMRAFNLNPEEERKPVPQVQTRPTRAASSQAVTRATKGNAQSRAASVPSDNATLNQQSEVAEPLTMEVDAPGFEER